jgi:excisionase family DNA binding protein
VDTASRQFTEERLMTPSEVAKRLRITVETFRSLVLDGELPYVHVGRGQKHRRMMFRPRDVEDFIERRTRREVPLRARRFVDQTSPTLRKLEQRIERRKLLREDSTRKK